MFKNNKKGFTLIELLVVIVIITSILILAIVNFNDISKKNKEKAWEKVKNQIKVAAIDYYDTNSYKLANVGDFDVNAKVSVRTLIEHDYLNVITDPRDGSKVDPCSYVEVTKVNGIFNYEYKETPDNMSCDKEEVIVVKEPGAPNISIKMSRTPDVANGFYNRDVNIQTTVDTKGNSQIKEVRYSYDGMDYNYLEVSPENIFTYEVPAIDGKGLEVDFVATNLAGKSATISIKYSKDTKAPDLNLFAKMDKPEIIDSYSRNLSISELTSLTDYKSGVWTNNGIYFKMSSSDDISGINSTKTYCTDSRYKPGDKYYSFRTYRRTIKTSDFNIVCQAEDQAGNKSKPIIYNAKVDTSPPTCTVSFDGEEGWNGWYVTKDVAVSLGTTDKQSGVKEYGLTTSNSAIYNGFESGEQKDETKGTTWYGYVKDNVGNTNHCFSSVKLEKNVEISFDPVRTNEAVSVKHNGKIFDKSYSGVCGYGECDKIKCIGPDSKRATKEYFARACMDVYSYSRYFYVTSISTGKNKSVKVTDLVDDNYDKTTTPGMKRITTLGRYDCKKNWKSDYKYNKCGGSTGKKNDFSAHVYKYVSESGLQSSDSIRLYTEYRYNCGY